MTRRGWVLFALMSVIWGIPYLMIKVADGGVATPVVVFARTALGALVLLPLAVRAGGMGVVLRNWRPVLAFAALEILGPWWLLSDAERRLSSSMTGLLIAAVPVLGVLLARSFGEAERLGVKRWVGMVLGLGGVAALAGPDLRGGDAWAIVEAMLAAVGYAVAPRIAARRLREVPSLPMTAACLGLAALVYLPAAVVTRPHALPPGSVLVSLAGLGLVCTALAFNVFFALIREVGASRALVITYVNPAVAVTAGILLLNEPLTPTIVVSFALVLAGSVLATGSTGSTGSARAPVPSAVSPAANPTPAPTPVPSAE